MTVLMVECYNEDDFVDNEFVLQRNSKKESDNLSVVTKVYDGWQNGGVIWKKM